MSQQTKPRVALLASADSSPAVLFGLFDVLWSVGAVFPDMVAGEPGDTLLEVTIVAADREPFRCIGNVLVEPHAGIAGIDRVDAVVVCDMYTPIDTPPRGVYTREIDWLRRMHANGTLIASVCSGSLLLAEAGLLEGRACTGHWAYRDLFRKHYPNVAFNGRSILNLENEPEGVITAAGVTAWQDLALYLIARLCGAEHALRTAKVHLLAGHEDGQGPFTVMGRRIQDDDAVISGCQAWIAQNYATANPVAGMAERSGLPPRTFSRRFRSATGYVPMDYVHAIRIEEARQVIESTDTSIDDVGYLVGYEDPTFFRRLFKRQTGLTPAAYRRKFAGILAAATAGSGAPMSAHG